MIVNVIGNIIFIPAYSYIASAWLTTVSETIVLLLTASFSLYFLRNGQFTAQPKDLVEPAVPE